MYISSVSLSLPLRFYMWDGCYSGVAWVYSYLLMTVGWVCTCACVRACLNGTLFGEDDTIFFHVVTGIPS